MVRLRGQKARSLDDNALQSHTTECGNQTTGSPRVLIPLFSFPKDPGGYHCPGLAVPPMDLPTRRREMGGLGRGGSLYNLKQQIPEWNWNQWLPRICIVPSIFFFWLGKLIGGRSSTPLFHLAMCVYVRYLTNFSSRGR
ncbi:hypothetical protein KIL84_018392 [Mauremys mutica]|uniref:Uncharacterized protein n=1 Tax=Mauremys mutica TaxID=74926 RepID=A0A9D3XT48_9SAUR|nr:hypothetical protein KIL84_018392 [Mauremys mutica]